MLVIEQYSPERECAVSEQWAKDFLRERRGEVERRIESWKGALETGLLSSPSSERGHIMRARVEDFLKRDENAINWLDGHGDAQQGRLAATEYLESKVELYPWMAREKQGGERMLESDIGEDVIPQEENEFFRLAGELFLSRRHAEVLGFRYALL